MSLCPGCDFLVDEYKYGMGLCERCYEASEKCIENNDDMANEKYKGIFHDGRHWNWCGCSISEQHFICNNCFHKYCRNLIRVVDRKAYCEFCFECCWYCEEDILKTDDNLYELGFYKSSHSEGYFCDSECLKLYKERECPKEEKIKAFVPIIFKLRKSSKIVDWHVLKIIYEYL